MCHKPCGGGHVSLRFCRMCPHGFSLLVIYGFVHKDTCHFIMWRITYGGMIYTMRRMQWKPCGENHMETWCQSWGKFASKHVETNIWRHEGEHEEHFMQTMWRIPYGYMISSIRRMHCQLCGEYHMEKWFKTWGECHGNHVENSIWRHDIKHEENAMGTMWRITYVEVMSNMRSMSCKPCGE